MFSEACQMKEAGQRLMFTPNLDGTYPGLWGHCLNHRQAYYTNEPQSHPASNGLPDGHLPLENFLAVPALLEGELVGQIALGNSSRGFTADDLDTVQRLAEVYAVALEKKRRIGEIVDSQRLYAQMFHNNHAIKLLIDPDDGSILDANQAACEFYGYLHEEITSISIFDINQLPRPEVTRRMQQARNSQRIDFTFPHRCADGSVRQMEVHSGRIKHGERELLLSILFDITEREQAERERERALSELRQTLEHVRTLRGLLPICSVCKKIRDDHGYWQQLEAYIARHSEATFTHGICPACEQKLLDDLNHSQEGHGPGQTGNE
jgi:PAS domain S-box-containing protein